MSKRSLIFIFVIVGICLLPLSSLKAQVIGIQWNTFLGSLVNEEGLAIVSDSAGNINVTGYSEATWGSPINPHSGGGDAFVAKLDNQGNLLWNTFFGSMDGDISRGISLDDTGNIYITGTSYSSWGSPVNPHGGYKNDVFVVKLDSSGNLLWNTFLGGTYNHGYDITLDSAGNIFVSGHSHNWGSPINGHSGQYDAFIAKLDSNGNLLWNTFLGGIWNDFCPGLVLDSEGNIYVTGYSFLVWDYDAFVAKLNSNGILLWRTFFGCVNDDHGYHIALDNTGDILVNGYSYTSWGSPINPHSGYKDVFVAKLDSTGNLLWNTFLGNQDDDYSYGIALDNAGNIYITGYSGSGWGNPINPHSGGDDAFVAGLDNTGSLLWNTFLGSESGDRGRGITLDNEGNIFVTGHSEGGWDNPINPHTGSYDAFVVKITPQPIPDIKANGSDDPIIITQSDTLQIKVSLISYGSTDDADWWLLTHSPFGWYYYDYSFNKWKSGQDVTRQGSLMNLNPKTVLNTSGLKPGAYTFYFGVDLNMNGIVTKSCLYYDLVKVTVTSD